MTEPTSISLSLPAVDAEREGTRLDKYIASTLPEISRMRIKGLIQEGQVRADDKVITNISWKVKTGQVFDLIVPQAIEPIPQGQDIPLNVVYEDDYLIVIDKPAGMVVHPAVGNDDGTLVNALIHHCGDSLSGINGVKRPGIVHRIDKDTSGLMVVAKTDLAHAGLAEQFADHSLERAYLAIVRGRPYPAEGTIDEAVGRSPRNRQKMAVVGTGGKHAVTHFKLIQRLGDAATLVECRLETGRTHQIRVHMTHIHHPLIGDPVYGRTAKTKNLDPQVREAIKLFTRQALHAYVIGFKHPVTDEQIRFESPIPEDMAALIRALETA
ncbi:MAG: RluA family pseudouridine synthase [Alphaproteobacteria bacterium]|jgi:23S rRNA pseudouridine1911/1915/1917 synthase|nr:RluA family pseudouridine synthase [Alphaproteobacteria bacterium]MBT4966705.1 RluA family pseudouridine synthase [Alphaproteobacteria bacterium]MBT5161930.1 RluA family pseudouridine synthase [Alphaproteobacteria bacterium]MBT5918643.1 RluA family pseudouridine synthase [Alphaproteobacteria bacterium]MBT6385586.1 RluA family pseudouridine synthase [Alphaproteobacteria bacterium]